MTPPRVVEGDCVEVLRGMEAASVDAIVTDPPAGIGFMGAAWDDFRRAANAADAGRDNVFGRTSQHGPEYARRRRLDKWAAPDVPSRGADWQPGSPIGREVQAKRCRKCGRQAWSGTPCACPQPDWDRPVLDARTAFVAWLTAVMRECLRVAKPGAHALVWSIPRTSHWTATAIEDAGWEVRDVIVHLFGSGFPKSLDVSKAIDKAAGAEREATGKEPRRPNPRAMSPGGVGLRDCDASTRYDAPVTDAARRWHGWGTALKPAAEHWILARKPLDGTIAATVLKHGTGALNIDGCRVAAVGGSPAAHRRATSTVSPRPAAQSNAEGRWRTVQDLERYGEERPGERIGRWPPNVALSHSDGCVRVGTKQVRGAHHSGLVLGEQHESDGDAFRFGGGRKAGGADYVDADGKEEVDDWRCVEGCAVAMLDAQSGELHCRGNVATGKRTPIRSTSYMDAVLRDNAPHLTRGDSGGASRFLYCAKADASQRAFLCRTCDRVFPATERDRHRKHDRVEHPTTKPVDLMRWLLRLVTPRGGLVLDPFAGSGTTGVAALAENVRFLGVEREPDYVRIARWRIEAEAPLFARPAGAGLDGGEP